MSLTVDLPAEEHERLLAAMRRLDILSELVAQKDGQYKHELDLDTIIYGRGYEGGRVGPYARLLECRAGEQLIKAGVWAGSGKEEWDGNSFYILVAGKLKAEFARQPWEQAGDEAAHRIEYEPEAVIGAEALLEGARTTATVSVPEGAEALVLEFKRPALRLLRKYPKFAQTFDKHYRDHGRKAALRAISAAGGPEFRLDVWREITAAASFEVYDTNHVLFREGEAIEHIFLIKRGWVGLTRAAAADGDDANAHRVHLGPGNCLGLEALAAERPVERWTHTATLHARTELLVIPVASLSARDELRAAVFEKFATFLEAGEERLHAPAAKKVVAARQHVIGTGLVDGTNLLVMDMDLCVRCGNCSLACHKMHGQSRLLRRGIQIERPRTPTSSRIQHALAPSVCLHCQDPECLTGCPTGAIGRYENGQIDIHLDTCIGCGDCATQCPYNAISLVPLAQLKPNAAVSKRGGNGAGQRTNGKDAPAERAWSERLKTQAQRFAKALSIRPAELPPPVPANENEPLRAVKCNLCAGTRLNPAGAPRQVYSCEENCPTGALARVAPHTYFAEIEESIGKVYERSATHVIGRNIHHRDWPARIWHALGASATVAVIGATVWAANRYGLNTPLPGTIWTLRWLTGFVGLGCIGVGVAYLARKQVYRRRWKPLRYWLLAHVYFSIIGAGVFLAHGGWHSGGLLTTTLMLSFDLVILSGLFGLACYKLLPRVMTRIEGTPLLIEDLRARRQELKDDLLRFDANDAKLRALIEGRVREHFFSLRYLWRQFLRREPLGVLLADARKEFSREADAQKFTPDERGQLLRAVQAAATLRRTEALIYLHRLLKLWVAPHVVFTVLMLALLVAHLAQVWFFAVH
jgi:Fe-S-cluster-containing dehydrogenase component/CRP-like cAMP-binding protein